VADNGETRTDEEALKLRFEYFKHITTVSTAATVAVVAVYGSIEEAMRVGALGGAGFLGLPRGAADELALAVPIVAVCGFFSSLVVSLRGMYLAADSQSAHDNSAAISRMSRWAMVSFILGAGATALVGAFLLNSILTFFMLLILTPILGVLLILSLIRRLVRASRRSGNR
jgi:cytochrome bd-type quinol oxidase subunit 2